MVRLKAGIPFSYVMPICFQFLYGAIKRSIKINLPPAPSFFNSSMVRLKFRLPDCAVNLPGFQFLYGAIKRANVRDCPKISVKFQFLYGAIKSFFACIMCQFCNEFQFLYGAIKSCTSTQKKDCIYYFNSSMVRLKDSKNNV